MTAICQEIYLLWRIPLNYKPTVQQYVNFLIHLTVWKSLASHCMIQLLKQLSKILSGNLLLHSYLFRSCNMTWIPNKPIRWQGNTKNICFTDTAFFYELKVCGNLTKPISTLLPTSFVHFVPCVTFGWFSQYFTLLHYHYICVYMVLYYYIYIYIFYYIFYVWWSVISGLWYYYYDSEGSDNG